MMFKIFDFTGNEQQSVGFSAEFVRQWVKCKLRESQKACHKVVGIFNVSGVHYTFMVRIDGI